MSTAVYKRLLDKCWTPKRVEKLGLKLESEPEQGYDAIQVLAGDGLRPFRDGCESPIYGSAGLHSGMGGQLTDAGL
jgi:hypothetical protein